MSEVNEEAGLLPAHRLHGVVAEFSTAEALVEAAHQTRQAGYERVDAYAPFAVEGLAEALRLPASRIPWIMLAGGTLGALAGLAMQYYANLHSYPMNIGGRPLNAWPAFIPATFELTILCAVLGGIVALFVILKLPTVYHPLFNHPDFRRASRDGFFLCIEAADKSFHRSETELFLRTLKPLSVQPVEE